MDPTRRWKRRGCAFSYRDYKSELFPCHPAMAAGHERHPGLEHREVDPESIEAVILNAKGFGGNNATVSVLSPLVTLRMLTHKHGEKALTAYQTHNEKVIAASAVYEELSNSQPITPIYKFDHNVRTGEDLSFTKNSIIIAGESLEIDLLLTNPYSDMCN